MKQILIGVGLVLGLMVSVQADPWGAKISVTSGVGVAVATIAPVSQIKIYNAGAADVAVSMNSSTGTLASAVTNNTAVLIPTLKEIVLSVSSAKSIQLGGVTNVVIQSTVGTNVVYVVGY